MACQIHGLPDCKFPSCVGKKSPLCDAHALDNCPACIAKPDAPISSEVQTSPSIPEVVSAIQIPPPLITDPHANKVMSAAEAYAQSCDHVSAIAANVAALKANLTAAKSKLREAKKSEKEAKSNLKGLVGGKK